MSSNVSVSDTATGGGTRPEVAAKEAELPKLRKSRAAEVASTGTRLSESDGCDSVDEDDERTVRFRREDDVEMDNGGKFRWGWRKRLVWSRSGVHNPDIVRAH